MVYLKIEQEDLRYQVWEIARLFFQDDEIENTQTEPPEETRGIFISGGFNHESARPEFRLDVKMQGTNIRAGIPTPESLITYTKSQHEAYRLFKRTLKRTVYSVLSKFTERELPWGVLTGIRPAKIVHEMLEKGKEREDILKTLREYYFVSPKKAELVFDVARVERSILDQSPPERVGIYIGIPFCPTRCLYCSFTSNPISKCRHLVDSYLTALKKEMDGVSEMIRVKGYTIESIYIGGGTPTSIEAPELRRLLDSVERSFDLAHLKEYTLEAGRPDSINADKLEVIGESRVDRISINPQTMNNDTLRLIGRNHTAQDIVNAFYLARTKGFNHINMDVIIGLPGENPRMFRDTLRKIKELGPESMTVHTMSIKRASRLNEDRTQYRLISSDEAAAMVEDARGFAEGMGMHPYYLYRQKNILGNLENIGYCKPGFESVYNIQIMEERQTILALGADAITKVVYPEENRIERAFNVKNVEEYIRRVDEMLERKRKLL